MYVMDDELESYPLQNMLVISPNFYTVFQDIRLTPTRKCL